MTLRALSLSDQISDHLAELIIRGDLAPGERLHETELARRLNVSTNSLREAFRVLEARRLVEIQPRKGARVCDITETQVKELYDFLFLLLAELAARAARTWQEQELEQFQQLLSMLEQLHRVNDMAAAHQMVFQFLPDLTRFARNALMARAIQDLTPLLQRCSYIALTEETTEFETTLRIFQDLLGNVLARNAEAAAQNIREYGDNQCRIVLRALAQRRQRTTSP